MTKASGQKPDLPPALFQARPRTEGQNLKPLPSQKGNLLLLAIATRQNQVGIAEEDRFSPAVVQWNSGSLICHERDCRIPSQAAQGRNLPTIRECKKKLVRAEVQGHNPFWPRLSLSCFNNECCAKQDEQRGEMFEASLEHRSPFRLTPVVVPLLFH
jgi:hypothetical protein